MREVEQEKGVTGQVKDFGQALFHSAIENPINGITQIINHSTGVNIPELEIAGAVKEPSAGAMAGTIAGGVLDYYVLSRVAGPVLGNVGGSGMTGVALRAGIVGGVFTGILAPSDKDSEHFFKDRLTNGMVGAATFAGMAAGGEYLNRGGYFAAPEVRSLSGSMTFGALSGAAGGIAQAEAEALFKKGQALPDIGDLASSTFNMAAFGAAFGALNYGYNKTFSPLRVTELQSEIKNPNGGPADKVNLKLYENANGEVLRLRAELPSLNDSRHIGWESTKLTNGNWSDLAKYVENGKWTSSYDSILVPKLTNITRAADGTVKIATTDGQTRVFTPDGEYQRVPTNPPKEAPKVDPSYQEHTGPKGDRTLYLRSEGGQGKTTGSASLEADGSIKSISAGSGPGGEANVFMQRVDGNTWKVSVGKTPDGKIAPSEYIWKGDVKAVLSNTNNQVTNFEFKPESGSGFTLPRTLEGLADTQKAILSNASFQGFESRFRYLRTDAQGNFFIRSGNSTINGTEGTMNEIPIKPGDAIKVKFDVGDRYPEWETHNIDWTKSLDGKLQVNGVQVKPNSIYDLRTLLLKES